MKYFSLPIHSTTDVITNSSTTIYTYSDRSVVACKEMINEILKTFDINLSCDDIFNIVCLLDNSDFYGYWLEKHNYEVDGNVYDFLNDIISGKEEKPEWMEQAEQARKDYGTTLYISAKNEKYQKIAKLVKSFLYSTYSEEHSC